MRGNASRFFANHSSITMERNVAQVAAGALAIKNGGQLVAHALVDLVIKKNKGGSTAGGIEVSGSGRKPLTFGDCSGDSTDVTSSRIIIGHSSNLHVAENGAKSCGGMLINHGAKMEVSSKNGKGTKIEIRKNTASSTDGGGMCVWSASDVKFEHGSTLLAAANEATKNGGGFSFRSSSISLQDSTLASRRNSALQDGGGIYGINSSISVHGPTSEFFIENNTAKQKGGGVFAHNEGLNVTIGPGVMCVINENEADIIGGGMYLENGINTVWSIKSNISLLQNNAFMGGGAALSPSLLQLEDDNFLVFRNNTAQYKAPGIFWLHLDESIERQVLDDG